jgi:protein O-GlcNAc transferase
MHNWIKQLFSNSKSAQAISAPIAAVVEASPEAAQAKKQGDMHLQVGDFSAAAQSYRESIAIDPGNAKTYNNLGFALNEQGLAMDAQAALMRALAIDPNMGDAHYLLGTIAQAQDQAELACDHFRKALKLAPDFEFAYRDLAFLLLNRGHMDDAKQVLMQGITRNPHLANLHFYLGNLYHEEQQFDLAVASFEQALLIAPDHIDFLVNLGLVLLKKNHPVNALPILQKAVALNPEDAGLHNTLGNALADLAQFDNAMASYRNALQISPDYADAHNNLGSTLEQLGRLDEAAASFRHALQINPESAEAVSNLGNILQKLGHFDDAVNCYRQALQLNPNYAEIHFNLGNLLKKIGRIDDAISSYRRVLEIKSDFAGVHCNLGDLLRETGRFHDAITSYREATRLKHDDASLHNNLAISLLNIGQHDEAISNYRRAIELDPECAEAHYNLGVVLQELARFDDALASYRRALEIKPNFPDAHNAIGNSLKDHGRLAEALISYRQALRIKPDFFEAYSNMLFSCNYVADQPAVSLLEEAKQFGELVARKARIYTEWDNVPDDNKTLRIGLFSGDLHEHPVGFFLEAILKALKTNASNQIELVAYSTSLRVDALTERIKPHFDTWRSTVALSDESLAGQIRDDRIDILIDLSGHSAHNRLPMFAWKPAPVQVAWLGYFATTGVSAIDYLIADPWTLPAKEEKYFTENIWRLPETRLCFTAPEVEIPVLPLPALTNGFITFGCFNNLTKMNDAVVSLWSSIMKAMPTSLLLLKAGQLNQIAGRRSVLERFAVHGIGEDRLIFEGFATRKDYFSSYNRIDIALDPFPYTGGTTTVEALWMGVPVLSLAGDSFISRQGVGLMMNAGLPDWIAADADDYFARAIRHAGDLTNLAMLRGMLRQQVLNSPIFDAPRFAGHFEAALRGMWQQWCKQQHESLASPHLIESRTH